MEMMKEEQDTNNEKKQYKYRGIKAMPFIIGNEAFERLGSVGTQSNLVVYITSVFHMNSVTTTTIINVFNGTSNMAPLVGGYLADTYFGRYKTVAYACVINFLGLALLALTAAIPKLHPPKCTEIGHCVEPNRSQFAVLIISFAFMVIGAGGIRSSNLAFGADQFDPNTESGKRGANSYFNWYIFSSTFAVMIAVTFIVYVQSSVSWSIGLAIPTFLMLVACLLFAMGSKIFVKVLPTGNPYKVLIQVPVAAFLKRNLKLPDNPDLHLFNYVPPNYINARIPRTDHLSCLDKATILTNKDELNPDGSAANPWRLCSIQQVEEMKCMMRVIPIWTTVILYAISLVQQTTYGVLQALQSDRRLGTKGFQVPAASFIIFSMLSLSIFLPIYDRVVVPILRKITGKEGGITILQRMGVGSLLSILTMVVFGLVEAKRRHMALAVTPPAVVSPMSAFWLVPPMFLAGITESLASAAQLEFFYKEFPENMRSIASSSVYLAIALSSYISGGLISIVHNITRSRGRDWLSEDLNAGRLDYFYYLIAVIGAVNLCFFVLISKWYRYKDSDGIYSDITNDEHRSNHII